jgi:nitrogen fixation protein FixH
MSLVLKVDTPRDGTTVTTSTVTVSGRVVGTESAGASVRVNDAEAPVKDGKFSTNVTLTEGKNIIKISAKGGQANIEEIRTVTYKK